MWTPGPAEFIILLVLFGIAAVVVVVPVVIILVMHRKGLNALHKRMSHIEQSMQALKPKDRLHPNEDAESHAPLKEGETK